MDIKHKAHEHITCRLAYYGILGSFDRLINVNIQYEPHERRAKMSGERGTLYQKLL
jgi:hypothetical protein